MQPLSERIATLASRPKANRPLVMLTAYDFVSAQIVDEAGVDLVLVGDSAATTVLGYTNTREIQFEELLMLTRAVRRGVQSSLLVGDLPFGTYEGSDDQAVVSARALVNAGADLVKLEGAGEVLPRVRAILAAGIPVVGHVGLLPQAYTSFDNLRARGRTVPDALEILRDGRELAALGCSALVVEAVPSVVAEQLALSVAIPVIGIGAGARVDGQVLVLNDLLGLGAGRAPKFVRRYAALRANIASAVQAFSSDVRARSFPSAREEYSMNKAEEAEFLAALL